MTLDPSQALGQLPEGLRTELVAEFGDLVRNYRERRWKASELDAGRFCEVVYTVLKGFLDGNYPQGSSKPSDLKSACDDLGKTPKTAGSDSVRITIPRILIGLYQVRNNRGVAHTGGDVDANHMDATYVLHACQWVMAELVRIFHSTDVDTATSVVDSLVERTVPVIWLTGGVRRLLNTSLPQRDQVLLLLYGAAVGVTDRQLADEMEKRVENLRKVLRVLHDERYIEWKRPGDGAILSPTGIREVEERLLPNHGVM